MKSPGLSLPVSEGTEDNLPGGIREGNAEGQIVMCSVPTPRREKNNTEDIIRRTDGTISLGEVGRDCQITWKAHKKIKLREPGNSGGSHFHSILFFLFCVKVSRKTVGGIGLLYEGCPTTALCYKAQFNLDWLLEK